jgi:hypothetical protein
MNIIKHTWNKSNYIARAYLIGCVPSFMALAFLDFSVQGLMIAVPVGIIIILIIALTLIALSAILVPDSLLKSNYSKITIYAIGTLLGLWLFNSTNRFYGSKNSAFKLATGIYPYWHVQYLEFDEDSWTDFMLRIKYAANPKFNQNIIQNGKYKPDCALETQNNGSKLICYSGRDSTVTSKICFDTSYSIGTITYSSY